METHDPNSESLRSELARLQDREATLTHLLNLEREKRVRAEHLFEVERLACFELGHKLAKQRGLHPPKPTQNGPSVGNGVRDTLLVNCDGHSNGYHAPSDTDSVECSIDFQDMSSSKVPGVNGFESKDNGCDDESAMSSNLSPLSTEEDFASSIFSQLPTDLQHMLGIGDKQEARDEEAYSRAHSAVLDNNTDSLQRYVSLPGLQNHKGKSLLGASCKRGHEGCVHVLMEAGWSPNEVTTDKQLPLHICARLGHLSSLKVLLDFGADPNASDESDQTPIFLALRAGHETTAQSLLEAGAELTTKTKDGLTLLHAAVKGNLPHTLRLLLTHLRGSLEGSKFKQMVNASDSSGSTPLHTAVSGGHKECVGVLCACEGVSVSQRDRWNRTPMDVASDEDCRELLRNRECRSAFVLVDSPDSFNGQQVRLVIGQLSILPHHRLTDIEPLIADLLSQYCNTLRGCCLYTSNPGEKPTQSTDNQGLSVDSKSARAESLFEKIEAEYELASVLKGGSVHKARKEGYLRDCYESVKNAREKISPLDLTGDSVATYQVGSVRWRPGGLDRGTGSKTLLSVFNEAKLNEKRSQDVVRITLKGLEDGHLDQLALQLMIPMAKLQEYIDLAEQHKALIIHGSQGSGKTQLAKALASYLKATKRRAQVVYFSLHSSFQRDDLFRLLHLNGLLIQHKEGSPTQQKGTHMVILDDLSSLRMPNVLAELLTSLEYRGAEHPMWVSDVYARDGSLLYPCGHYYLHSSTYFIATTCSESVGGEWVDQFAHISFGHQTSSSVLIHHLSARLVHTLRGVTPHATLPLCRMVWWVFQVWVLYNDFVRRIGLQQLAVGVRHFIQCPVEADKPDAVSSWLVSLWNHHLAPAIQTALLTPSPPSPPSPPSQNHTLQDFQLVSKCLLACLEVVFRPACPLGYEARERCMEQLRSAVESGGLEKRGEKERGDVKDNKSTPTKSQSTTPNKTRGSSTPPTSHPTHKPPIPPQPGSMVSYEDMLRDSPRNRAKRDRNRTDSTNSSKSMTLDNHTISKPAPVHVGKAVPRSNQPRKSTLRKLRSKTISLFSKDHGGSSTLPRLFKRGSRTSLNLSAEAEETDHPQTSTNPAKEAKHVEDMFNLLSTANSKRYEDQRSPSPSPSPPPMTGSDTVEDKRKDLDNFLDMLSSVNTSRIEEQRSPPPPRTPTKSKSKKYQKETNKTVPRYTLPTGSPLRDIHKQHPSTLLGIRGSSPPAYSTPNIVSEVESEQTSYQTSSRPIQRKYTNTSLGSYDSDLLFTDDRSCEHSYATASTVYRHEPSPRSEPDPASLRQHAQAYNTTCTASEPLHRRRPQLDPINTQQSPVKPTPQSGRSVTSPLTMATYSSPRSSPMTQQGTQGHGDARPLHPSVRRVRSIKANSVTDIMEVDELGTVDEFDLFRAASEGDLMQSSAKEGFFDFSPTNTENAVRYKEDQISYSQNAEERPSYGYQSSPDDEDSQLEINSVLRKSSRTSGYGSDSNTHTADSRRQRSYSTSVGYKSQTNHFSTVDRRYSSTYEHKKNLYSPTNSLPRGRRSSSDVGSLFSSNLLYSASLGFDSLSRLSSSRDHLSSVGGSQTDDLTTEM